MHVLVGGAQGGERRGAVIAAPCLLITDHLRLGAALRDVGLGVLDLVAVALRDLVTAALRDLVAAALRVCVHVACDRDGV